MFYRFLFSAVFLLFTMVLSAQSKWQVGITTNTGFSGWYTNDNEGLSPGDKYGNRFALAYGGGLTLTYSISNNWSLGSGIIYQNTATRWLNEHQRISTEGEKYTNTIRNTYRLNQLQVPLQLKWHLNKKRNGAFVNIGFASNYVLGGTQHRYRFNTLTDEGIREKNPHSFTSNGKEQFHIFVQPTIGFGGQFSERWSWATNFTWGKGMTYYFQPTNFDCKGLCEYETLFYNKRALLFELNYQLF